MNLACTCMPLMVLLNSYYSIRDQYVPLIAFIASEHHNLPVFGLVDLLPSIPSQQSLFF